jgi:hypothetical protein
MCDETERRINYLVNKCKELKVEVKRPKDIKEFEDGINELAEDKRRAMHLLFDTVEADV